MYRVLNIDVEIHIIIFTVINLFTNEKIKIEVSRYTIAKNFNIKQNDIVTFSKLYYKRYSTYDGKDIKLI